MADLATLGLAVDSSQVTSGTDALGKFSQAGNTAGMSAVVVEANAKRMGISVEEASRRTALAANSMNLAAAQATRMADATRQAAVANDNLSDSMEAANDNIDKGGRSAAASVLHYASLASTLVTLYGAAYRFSPAFKGLADSFTTSGLAAMTATQRIVASAVSTALGTLISFLARLASMIFIVVEAWKLFVAFIKLGTDQIAVFNQMTKDAFSAGVGVDFFQRMTEAAKAFKHELQTDEDAVKEMTDMLKKFNDASNPKLDGSALQNRLDALLKAGNFKGNAGVDQFSDAKTAEERFRAIVNLMEIAATSGKQLGAALDIGSQFMSPDQLARFKSGELSLKEMLKAADALKADDLFKKDDIDKAAQLTDRLNAAWKTITDTSTLTKAFVGASLNLHEVWVGTIELLATAVDWANKFIDKLSDNSWMKSIDDWLKYRQEHPISIINTVSNLITGKDAITKAPESIYPTPTTEQRTKAFKALEVAMRQHILAQEDLSKSTNKVEDAFDKMMKAMSRANATELALAEASGGTDAEKARLKAIAQLTEAANQAVDADKRNSMSDYYARIEDGANKAAAAAEKLAIAKVKTETAFSQGTMFLTPEDVQIATQLKGIYGTDIPAALNSSYAAAIRMNTAIKGVSDQISGGLTTSLADFAMGTKSAGDAFKDFANIAIRAIEEMIIKLTIVQPLMQSIQGMMGGGGGILSFLGLGGAAPSPVGWQGPTLDMVGGGHSGNATIGNSNTYTFQRQVNPAYFDNAIRMHSGGMLGSDEVPFIGKKGEEVGWPDQFAKKYGGGQVIMGDTNITIAGNADEKTIKMLQEMLQERDEKMPEQVIKIMNEKAKRRA